MKPYLLLSLVLILGLSGCQPTNGPSSNETPAASLVAATATLPKFTPTSIPVATATPEPTLMPAPTATPLPVASLTETGLLLIWDDQTKHYTVFELNTGNPLRTIPWNSECEWELMPHVTTTVCEHQSGQWYLFDILKETTQDVPIWNAKLIGWDPNGRFLVFTQGTTDKLEIFSYDITANMTQTLALNIERQEQLRWLTQPALSADGQELIVVRETPDEQNTSVFELLNKAKFRQIGLTVPPATWDAAWSPTSGQLVYGATDIEQEIGPSPNYLFIVDTQTGKIQELGKSPAPLFFWSRSLEWSPTGKQIAVGLWDLAFKSKPQACIINIDTARQECLPSLRSTNGSFVDWSPSGEHIAFVDLDKNLTISKSDGTEAVKLLENIPGDFLLFWR